MDAENKGDQNLTNSEPLSTETFANLIKNRLLISRNNRNLSEKFSNSDVSTINSKPPSIPEMNNKTMFSHKKLNVTSPIHISIESPLYLFLLPQKALKNSFPDFDFIRANKKYIELSSNANSNIGEYFELAKIKCFEGDYSKSLLFINKCLSIENCEKFKFWKFALMIKLSYDLPLTKIKKNFCCCTIREKIPKKETYKKLVKKISKLNESIEKWWFLLVISLAGVLQFGKEIEHSRYYASNIKKLSEYYGYLAWAYIFMNEGSPKAIEILEALKNNYQESPEAYYLAWTYFYELNKYQDAKEIASEAFLRVSDQENYHFHIIFSLKLAKSYFLNEIYDSCLQILFSKYIEYPNYPVFLYYFCKYSIKSNNYQHTSICKGILKELLRICDVSREGPINFWLCKSHFYSNQYPECYKFALKSLNSLDYIEKEKISEMKKIIYDLQNDYEIIENIQKQIELGNIDQDLMNLIKTVRVFCKIKSELLEADTEIRLGNNENALKILQKLSNNARFEKEVFLKILKIERFSNENYFIDAFKKSSAYNVPVQNWVKFAVIYSKFLFNLSRYDESLKLLRFIAKLVPNLPFLDIPYCVALKNANSESELKKAYTKIYSISNSPEKNKNFYSAKKLTSMFFPDLSPIKTEDLGSIPFFFSVTKKNGKNNKNLKKIQNFSLATSPTSDKDIEYDAPCPMMPNLWNFEEFSICSKPKFLFYIAKFLMLIKKNKEEALLALKDYKELLWFEKLKNKADRKAFKANLLEKCINETM